MLIAHLNGNILLILIIIFNTFLVLKYIIVYNVFFFTTISTRQNRLCDSWSGTLTSNWKIGDAS